MHDDMDFQAACDPLPDCYECGRGIKDPTCYEINGEAVCEDCLEQNHKKYTTDMMG